MSTMLQRFATIQKFAGLPDRTIVATASDETPDRAGDVMVAAGCDAAAYRSTITIRQSRLERRRSPSSRIASRPSSSSLRRASPPTRTRCTASSRAAC